MNKTFRSLLRSFVDGVFVVIPFIITVFLIFYPLNLLSGWISSFADTIFRWFLNDQERGVPNNAFFVFLHRFLSARMASWLDSIARIPYINILFIVFLLTLFGMIASSFWIQSGVRLLERVIMKIPGLNLLYCYAKESTAAFVGKFNKPVCVTLNKELNIQKIGFMTQEDVKNLRLPEGKVAVYIPHSYAFSGELFFFPNEDVQLLNVTPTEAWKVIFSGGIAKIKSF